MRNAVTEQAGHRGCKLVKSGTDANTGTWSEIQIVTDTVFTTCTNQQNTGHDYASVTFPAGLTLFGYFTAVTRSSGTYILHNA